MSTAGRLDEPFRLDGLKVYVAGHRGMVGQALVRRLDQENCEILSVGRDEVDLLRQQQTEDWMEAQRPDVVFLAAATVGGIVANDTRPGEFIYNNLVIETNVIEAARRIGVKKLLMLGSSCIYPRLARQPMAEDALLTGPLEPTNQWYAIAKIAGIKLCQAYRRQYGLDFISAMPTNLYGPGDNFHDHYSHVVPALIRKIHTAKATGAAGMEIWGTGTPRREFLHVDDCADALVHLMNRYSGEEHVNVGAGEDRTIRDLAVKIAEVIGFTGTFSYDTTKPDGTPRKLLDIGLLNALGWSPSISLEDGLRSTYEWYCSHVANEA